MTENKVFFGLLSVHIYLFVFIWGPMEIPQMSRHCEQRQPKQFAETEQSHASIAFQKSAVNNSDSLRDLSNPELYSGRCCSGLYSKSVPIPLAFIL